MYVSWFNVIRYVYMTSRCVRIHIYKKVCVYVYVYVYISQASCSQYDGQCGHIQHGLAIRALCATVVGFVFL